MAKNPDYDISMGGCPTADEFMQKFKTEKESYKFILKHILPDNKPVCPYCGCTKYITPSKKWANIYNCGHCTKTVNFNNGTMFEYNRIPYKKCLFIIYKLFIARKSIPNYQLMRDTGLSQTCVYTFRRKVQAAMGNRDFKPFSGVIQIDEMGICGSNHGRFCKEGEGTGDGKESKKYPVIGIFEQDTHRVYSHPAIKNEKGQYLTGEQLKTFITKTCLPGSIIVSDDFRGYNFLNKKDSGYHHESVNHSIGERVNKNGFTTNGIEGYWGIAKRAYYSTHTNLPRKWIHFYLSEFDWRYAHNKWKEAIDDVLYGGVYFPQIIDIRKMGKVGEKTHSLKKYRMILPECLEHKNLEDITVKDILNCKEPVYGILKKPYRTRMQQKCGKSGRYGKYCYPKDWRDLGFEPYHLVYKDYRDNVVNTPEDILQMIKTATKYSEVNTFDAYNGYEDNKSYYNPKKERVLTLRKTYDNLPPILKTQIKEEFPNMFMLSSKDKIGEIHKRLRALKYWYKKNQEFLENAK